MTSTLTAIDWLLAAAGFLLLAVHFSRVARGSATRSAALRLHHIREDSIFVVTLAYLLTALALDMALRRALPDPTEPRFRMVVGSGAQLVGAVACVLVVSRRFSGGFSAFWFGPAPPRGFQKLTVVLAVTVIGMGICPLLAEGMVRLVRVIAPTASIETHPTLHALGGEAQPNWIRTGLWLGAALIAPTAEEFFFRGMLQNFLASSLSRPFPAILLSSLAFGAVHLSQAHTVPALVVFGILLGYAYQRTGAIVVPVTIHALFNLKTLIWYSLGAGPGP